MEMWSFSMRHVCAYMCMNKSEKCDSIQSTFFYQLPQKIHNLTKVGTPTLKPYNCTSYVVVYRHVLKKNHKSLSFSCKVYAECFRFQVLSNNPMIFVQIFETNIPFFSVKLWKFWFILKCFIFCCTEYNFSSVRVYENEIIYGCLKKFKRKLLRGIRTFET